MKSSEITKYVFGTAVVVAGIVLMIIGVRNGELVIVLQKAIQICMECIGIG